MTAPTDPKSSTRPDAKKPEHAATPERVESDPKQQGGCDATPGGRGDDPSKPDCPEGYPEEQQTDDTPARPGDTKPRPGAQTPKRNRPDQRDRD